MTESQGEFVADLHTKAAYAHLAAAHEHSTGDHASAQELAQLALGDSEKAVKCSVEMVTGDPRSMAA